LLLLCQGIATDKTKGPGATQVQDESSGGSGPGQASPGGSNKGMTLRRR